MDDIITINNPRDPMPGSTTSPAVNEITFSCWSCEVELRVPLNMAGISGPCPRCGCILAAPAVQAPTFQSTVPQESPPGYRVPAPPPLKADQDPVPKNALPAGGIVGMLISKTATAIISRLVPHITNPTARKFVTLAVYGSCVLFCVLVALIVASHLAIPL